MECFEVKDLKIDSHYKNIKKLYNISFPLLEKVPFYFINKAVINKNVYLTKYIDNDKLLGFSITIINKTNNFLFYIAVDPNYRNCGYGTKMLRHVLDSSDKPLYLTAEYYPEGTPDTDIRVKRIKYYKKNGLVILPDFVIEFGVKMFVLGTNSDVDYHGYKEIYKKIYGKWSYLALFFVKLRKK